MEIFVRIILITLLFMFFNLSVKANQGKKNNLFEFIGKDSFYNDENQSFYKYKFKNGLKLVVLEGETDEVNLNILVNAGNSRELEKVYAIPLNPYLSEKIFLNSKSSSKLNDFYVANDELFQTFNYIKFSYEFDPEKFDFVISNAFQAIKNPDLSNSGIEKAKNDVRNYMDLKFNNSFFLSFFKCLKDKKLIERDPNEEILRVNNKKVKEYYSKFFTSNNIIIIVESKLKAEFIANKLSKFVDVLPNGSPVPYVDVKKLVLAGLNLVNQDISCEVKDKKISKMNLDIKLFPNFNYTAKDIIYRSVLSKAISNNYSIYAKNDKHKIIMIENMDFPSNNYFLDSFSIMNLKDNNENFNEIVKQSVSNVLNAEQKIDEEYYLFDNDKKLDYLYYNVMLGENNIYDQGKINQLAKDFDIKDFENWVNKKYLNNEYVISVSLNTNLNVETLK